MPVKHTWEEQISDPRAHAYRTFFEASRELFDVLSAELISECQLDITWYDVLLHLDESPTGRMGMTDLAESVVITRGGLTKLIDRMEAAGLVERIPSPSDRRAKEIALTPEGRKRFQAAAVVHRRGIVRHFMEHVKEREAGTIIAALARVRAALAPASPPRP